MKYWPVVCSATGRYHCCTHFTDKETEGQSVLSILAKVTQLVTGKGRWIRDWDFLKVQIALKMGCPNVVPSLLGRQCWCITCCCYFPSLCLGLCTVMAETSPRAGMQRFSPCDEMGPTKIIEIISPFQGQLTRTLSMTTSLILSCNVR